MFERIPTVTASPPLSLMATSPPLSTTTLVIPRLNKKSATASPIVPATAANGVRSPLPMAKTLRTIFTANGLSISSGISENLFPKRPLKRATPSKHLNDSSAARTPISGWGTFPTEALITSLMGPHSAITAPPWSMLIAFW